MSTYTDRLTSRTRLTDGCYCWCKCTCFIGLDSIEFDWLVDMSDIHTSSILHLIQILVR